LFDLSEMPYKLVFKDISGYYDDCNYCGQNRCGGCTVPFTDQITIQKILTDNLKLESNDTLFSSDRYKSGKELQVQIVWH
jgi:hypothetical protein